MSADRKAAKTGDPLLDEPQRYTLFAALRRIETRSGGALRLGETRRIEEDPVRIVQDPVMHFSPSEVVHAEQGPPLRLHIESFGLFGPNGALPLHLTDYAASRARQQDDRAFLEFVALLQHRMATLFYRAWAMGSPAVDVQSFRSYLAGLMGLGTDGLARRDSVEDDAKLYRAGRFGNAARSREGLEDVLSDYFRTAVSVEAFEPRWLEIPAGQRTMLGRSRLGVDTTPGRRSWQCQFNFRVVFDGLRFTTFEKLLPGGTSLERLRDLIVLYAGKEQRWKIELRLLPGEAPPLRLSSGNRLGWTTWVGRPGRPRVMIHDTTALGRAAAVH